MELRNHTPFAADSALSLTSGGQYLLIVVIKATFQWTASGELRVKDEQESVVSAPRYLAEPGRSSLTRAAELVPLHPGMDVTLLGAAHPPKATTSMTTSLRVGALHSQLRVIGDRVWEPTIGGMRLRPSNPLPFEHMPIVYERAFGGAEHRIEAQQDGIGNPVGRGCQQEGPLRDEPLPNIECVEQPLRAPGDRVPARGYGPLDRYWAPRCHFAGSYDDHWRARQAPLPPEDLDARFFISAPPDLWSDKVLRGGEPIELDGLSIHGPVRLSLPTVPIGARSVIGSGEVHHPVKLDRIIIDSERDSLSMVWRATQLLIGLSPPHSTTVLLKQRIDWQR